MTSHGRLLLSRVLTILMLTCVASAALLEAEQQEELMKLSSPAFDNGAFIPSQYTCEGSDISPTLTWTEPPPGTKAFALISDDPDAPMGTWVHWVIYNLPPDARELPEDVPKGEQLANGALQGLTGFRRVGYGGPCPPPGPAHRYFFKLYALDSTTNLPPRASKAELEKAIKGHVLAEAQLIGRYQR